VVAPLRAHGVTSGAILVVDRLIGDFSDDDARLLSAAATHAAVVLSNARFFELIRVGKEQWETTFDALGAGIALVDAGGTIRRCNRAVADLVGAPIPTIIGRRLGEALFGGAAIVAELLPQAAAAHRPVESVRRSESLGRMLRLLVAPLPNPTDEVAAVVIVEDITEQKQLEAQLLQAEKLASVGTLVSGVAHELNNPLTSIAGLSEFLLEQGVGTGPQREHLRVINDQAGRASRIVRNLLSFARKSSGEHAPVDLGDIAQRAVLLMNYEFQRRGITVETHLEPGTPLVLGNRDELQQVLLNLLTNAAHALEGMPEGAPRRLDVTVGAEASMVVLRARDTGPGIAPEAALQIFDPFFTTKPPGEGTGLGLFLSYGIAETHGGNLAVESAPGRGATFILTLPAAPAAAPAAAPSAPQSAGRRILIVDDDAAAVRVVTALFRHDGHTVDAVGDGDAALPLLHAHDYDLILADMRATAGRATCRETLRRERPQMLARLVLTSTDRFATPPADLPGARILQKPFDLRALRETAAALWDA
jgi:two-component system NtrC family sensor kinase